MPHTETQYYKLFKEFIDLVMDDDFLSGSVFGISNSVNLSTIFPNILLRWTNKETEENLQFYRESALAAKKRYQSLNEDNLQVVDSQGLFGLCLMIYCELHLDIPMVETMKELKIPKWNYDGFLPLSACSLLPNYVPKLNKVLYERTKLPDDEVVDIVVKLQELSVDDFLLQTYSKFINISSLLDNLNQIILSSDDKFKWSSVLVSKTILNVPYSYQDLLKILMVPLDKYKKSLNKFNSGGVSDFDIILSSKEVEFFFTFLSGTPEGNKLLNLSQEKAVSQILTDLDVDEVSQLLFFDNDEKQKIKASNALIFDVLMNAPVVKYVYLNEKLNKISYDSQDDSQDDFKL